MGSLNPSGPYPILVLQGGPGSAKSTTAKMLKEVIDPNEGFSEDTLKALETWWFQLVIVGFWLSITFLVVTEKPY